MIGVVSEGLPLFFSLVGSMLGVVTLGFTTQTLS